MPSEDNMDLISPSLGIFSAMCPLNNDLEIYTSLSKIHPQQTSQTAPDRTCKGQCKSIAIKTEALAEISKTKLQEIATQKSIQTEPELECDTETSLDNLEAVEIDTKIESSNTSQTKLKKRSVSSQTSIQTESEIKFDEKTSLDNLEAARIDTKTRTSSKSQTNLRKQSVTSHKSIQTEPELKYDTKASLANLEDAGIDTKTKASKGSQTTLRKQSVSSQKAIQAEPELKCDTKTCPANLEAPGIDIKTKTSNTSQSTLIKRSVSPQKNCVKQTRSRSSISSRSSRNNDNNKRKTSGKKMSKPALKGKKPSTQADSLMIVGDKRKESDYSIVSGKTKIKTKQPSNQLDLETRSSKTESQVKSNIVPGQVRTAKSECFCHLVEGQGVETAPIDLHAPKSQSKHASIGVLPGVTPTVCKSEFGNQVNFGQSVQIQCPAHRKVCTRRATGAPNEVQCTRRSSSVVGGSGDASSYLRALQDWYENNKVIAWAMAAAILLLFLLLIWFIFLRQPSDEKKGKKIK